MKITVLKHQGRTWYRAGHSSGPPDGSVLFKQGGFVEMTSPPEGLEPRVEGDWFNKDWPYIPGSPPEPGAYWLKFHWGWSLADVKSGRDNRLWYTRPGVRPAPLRNCSNLDGYVPIPEPVDTTDEH